MTDQELQELERLCEQATPGPWVERGQSFVAAGHTMIAEIVFGSVYDRKFIVAARAALPRLIAEAWIVRACYVVTLEDDERPEVEQLR